MNDIMILSLYKSKGEVSIENRVTEMGCQSFLKMSQNFFNISTNFNRISAKILV